MYSKALSAGDKTSAEQIMSERDPKNMKRLGMKITGFSREVGQHELVSNDSSP